MGAHRRRGGEVRGQRQCSDVGADAGGDAQARPRGAGAVQGGRVGLVGAAEGHREPCGTHRPRLRLTHHLPAHTDVSTADTQWRVVPQGQTCCVLRAAVQRDAGPSRQLDWAIVCVHVSLRGQVLPKAGLKFKHAMPHFAWSVARM